jgi:hypothetical protein
MEDSDSALGPPTPKQTAYSELILAYLFVRALALALALVLVLVLVLCRLRLLPKRSSRQPRQWHHVVVHFQPRTTILAHPTDEVGAVVLLQVGEDVLEQMVSQLWMGRRGSHQENINTKLSFEGYGEPARRASRVCACSGSSQPARKYCYYYLVVSGDVHDRSA